MTRDLVTSEGVDDASSKGTDESAQTPAASGKGDAGPDPDVSERVSAASPGPFAAGQPQQPATPGGGGGDVLGEPPHGTPDDDADPVDMESAQARQARAERGTGQQYSVGEG